MHVDDIFSCILNGKLENWLIKSGLMDLIKSKPYQVALISNISPPQHKELPPLYELRWSRAFKMAQCWFELDVLRGNFDTIHKTDWKAKINDIVLDIHGKKVIDLDSTIKIKEVVIFWIIHYSLLIALANKRLNIEM